MKFLKFLINNIFSLVSPDKMKEIQSKLDAERKALAESKDMVEVERNKAAASLEKRERDLRKAQ